MGWHSGNCDGTIPAGCCEVCSDNFDRAAENPVSGWTVLAGTFEIVGTNQYATGENTANDPMLAMLDSCTSLDAGAIASVRIRSADEGALGGIVLRQQASPLFYYLFLVSIGDTCSQIQVWKHEGGVDEYLGGTISKEIKLNEWHTLRACFRETQDGSALFTEVLTASGKRITFSYLDTTTGIDGNGAGLTILNAGTAFTIDFDNFRVEYSRNPYAGLNDPICCGYCYYYNPCVCEIFTDDFDDPDTTEVACYWYDAFNAFSISSGVLTVDQSNVYIRTLFFPSTAHYLSAQVKGYDEGDELRLIVAFADVDNYLYVQLTVSDTCGLMQLFQVEGGVHTQLGTDVFVDAPTDAFHTAYACYDGTYLTGRIESSTGDSKVYRKPATVLDGVQIGIGTGTITARADFDNVDYQHYKGFCTDQQGSFTDICPECIPDPLPCVIVSDTFDRANNDDPGCKWEEISGDYDIDSNNLVPSTGGLIVVRVPHPLGSVEAYVATTVLADSNGDSIKIVVNYLDASNYHYVEVAWGVLDTNTNGRLRFYKREGGVETQLGDSETIFGLVGGGTAVIQVCFFGGLIEALVNNAGFSRSATAIANGDRAGIAGGDSSVKIQSYSYEVLQGTYNTLNCDSCIIPGTVVECWPCEDGILPTQLKLTFNLPLHVHSNAEYRNNAFETPCEDAECNTISGTVFVEYNSTSLVGDRCCGYLNQEIPLGCPDTILGQTVTYSVRAWICGYAASVSDPDREPGIYLVVQVDAGDTELNFRKRLDDLDDPVDCLNLSNVEVPYHSQSSQFPQSGPQCIFDKLVYNYGSHTVTVSSA